MNLKVLISVTVICFVNVHVTNGRLELDFDSNKFPFDRGLYEDVLNPEECQRQLSYITLNNSLLLTRFLDAGIRVPRGVLMGNLLDLGNYHQCMSIEEELEDMTINGKFCTIRVPVNQDLQLPEFPLRTNWKFDPSELRLDEKTINGLEAIDLRKVSIKSGVEGIDIERENSDSPLSNLRFRLAVCIPRPCTTNEAINGLFFNLSSIGFEYTDDFCRLPDDRPWAPVDYIAVVVFSLLGIVTLVSTGYDLHQSMYLKKDPKEIKSIYRSFSVYTNTQRLLTFNSSSGSLDCLNGIRALAMIWVILGHSFFTITDTANPIEAFEWSTSSRAMWVTVSPLTVDTFFLLSGLLLVYTTAGKVGRMDLLKNLPFFYLHRLLRMFPILAAVILFEASIFMHISDGPLWNIVAVQAFKCREFWWSTLLHVQNFVNPREACIGVSWYLAIDIQLHILSPLILFWVLSSKRSAWISLNTAIVATLIASTTYIFINNFPSGIISPTRPADMTDFFIYYYVNILTRASPFLIGMMYGYLLHLWRNKEIDVLGSLTIGILLCSMAILLVVAYCAFIAMELTWDNQLADNIFNSFLRPLWALATGWMIFACVQGKAGLINWFLCLPIWKLPARISYAMYLIHYSIMVGFYSSLIGPLYFTVSAVLFNFVAFLSATIVLAFFATLLIESPFTIIFNLLLKSGPKKSHSRKPLHEENNVSNGKIGIANNAIDAQEEAMKSEPLNTETNNDDFKLDISEGKDNTLLIEEELKNKDN